MVLEGKRKDRDVKFCACSFSFWRPRRLLRTRAGETKGFKAATCKQHAPRAQSGPRVCQPCSRVLWNACVGLGVRLWQPVGPWLSRVPGGPTLPEGGETGLRHGSYLPQVSGRAALTTELPPGNCSTRKDSVSELTQGPRGNGAAVRGERTEAASMGSGRCGAWSCFLSLPCVRLESQ